MRVDFFKRFQPLFRFQKHLSADEQVVVSKRVDEHVFVRPFVVSVIFQKTVPNGVVEQRDCRIRHRFFKRLSVSQINNGRQVSGTGNILSERRTRFAFQKRAWCDQAHLSGFVQRLQPDFKKHEVQVRHARRAKSVPLHRVVSGVKVVYPHVRGIADHVIHA